MTPEEIRDLQTQWTARQIALDKYAVELAAGALAYGAYDTTNFVARMYDLAEAFLAEGDRRRTAKASEERWSHWLNNRVIRGIATITGVVFNTPGLGPMPVQHVAHSVETGFGHLLRRDYPQLTEEDLLFSVRYAKQ